MTVPGQDKVQFLSLILEMPTVLPMFVPTPVPIICPLLRKEPIVLEKGVFSLLPSTRIPGLMSFFSDRMSSPNLSTWSEIYSPSWPELNAVSAMEPSLTTPALRYLSLPFAPMALSLGAFHLRVACFSN